MEAFQVNPNIILALNMLQEAGFDGPVLLDLERDGNRLVDITLVNKPRQIMQSVLYYRHGYDTSFEGFSGNQEDHQGAGHSPA